MQNIPIIFLVLSFGCAPITQRQPIVYTLPHNASYPQDRTECEQFAKRAISEDPTAMQGAIESGIGGALIGAALGAVIGGVFGMPGAGAGWGAGLGGIQGAAGGAGVNAIELARRTQEAEIKCLRARGYSDASY